MRWKRLIPLAAVTLALAPGTLVRTTPPPPDTTAPVAIDRIAHAPSRHGPLVLEQVWQMSSDNSLFGGFSALLVQDGTSLLAVSDSGRALAIRLDDGAPTDARFRNFAGDARQAKWDRDVESLARDPADGTIWAGFEYSNSIKRISADNRVEGTVRPLAMRHWDDNSGPEAMTRLADGRFVVIGEGTRSESGGGHEALLFAADPTDPQTPAPIRFHFAGMDGFRPVDLTPLADGRVLILMRRLDWPFPPRFSTAIMIADAAAIVAGRTWKASTLATFGKGFPAENYEGLSVEIDGSGRRYLWLVSDDNFVAAQRTLLLRLRWPG